MSTTFDKLYRDAKQHDDYWLAGNVLDFTEEVCRLLNEQGVSRSELARRLGTSPAYVTKMLRGNTNFTLATMTRVARALDCKLDLRLLPAVRDVEYPAGVLPAQQVAEPD